MAPHAVEVVAQIAPSDEPDASLKAEVPTSKARAPLRTVFPPLELEEHPIDDYPSIRAIVVGAGPAGITAGVLLTHKVPGLQLVIYERNDEMVSLRPGQPLSKR